MKILYNLQVQFFEEMLYTLHTPFAVPTIIRPKEGQIYTENRYQ